MGVCEDLKDRREEIAGRIPTLLAEVEMLRSQVTARRCWTSSGLMGLSSVRR